MQDIESRLIDKLSNLATELVTIERGEGTDRDENQFKIARKKVIDTIGVFHQNRYALGRALAEYQRFYKQNHYWLLARKAIAVVLGCDQRTVSRIIENSVPAAGLSPFALEALEAHMIDPGRKKHAGIVKELLNSPVQESREQADADLRVALTRHSSARSRARKPVPESIEGFARRMVKLFLGRFESAPPAAQGPELRYCIEMVLTALHTDIGTLRCYSSLNEVPTPKSKGKDVSAAA